MAEAPINQDIKEQKEFVNELTRELEGAAQKDAGEVIWKKLRIVGSFISSGMDRFEAGVLALLSKDDMISLSATYPSIERYLQFKELRYKASLLSSLYESVKQGGTKEAIALLEQKYPDEFNRKASTPEDPTKKDNILHKAFDHVRNAGDSQPLVKSDTPVQAGARISGEMPAPHLAASVVEAITKTDG